MGGSIDDTMRKMLDEALAPIRRELTALRACIEARPGAQHPRFLSPEEAGDIAGVKTATIRDWISRGELQGHHAGRLLRIELTQLENYLRRHQRPDDARVDARTSELAKAACAGRKK